MNDKDLRVLIEEHNYSKKHITSPQCPICHYPMTPKTIIRYIDQLDMHGGICWGTDEEVPVWKCVNGHAIHLRILEGT